MCPGLSSAPAHRVTPDSPVRFADHHKWFLDHLNDEDVFLMIITINLIIWVTQICAPGYSMDGGTCRPRQEECPRGMFRLKQWKWFLLKFVLIRTFLDKSPSWSFRGRGGGCSTCPCPLTNPSNQFATSCFLDQDEQVKTLPTVTALSKENICERTSNDTKDG